MALPENEYIVLPKQTVKKGKETDRSKFLGDG
jgi:hypothetical protein